MTDTAFAGVSFSHCGSGAVKQIGDGRTDLGPYIEWQCSCGAQGRVFRTASPPPRDLPELPRPPLVAHVLYAAARFLQTAADRCRVAASRRLPVAPDASSTRRYQISYVTAGQPVRSPEPGRMPSA